MTAAAVVMLVLAVLLVWGGLALSLRYLARHPLADREEIETVLRDEPGADATW